MVLQHKFDAFALKSWKQWNGYIFRVCRAFLSYADIPFVAADDDLPEVQRVFMGLELPRAPDLHRYPFANIGGWLFKAYPGLFDKVAEVGDSSKIDLSSMRYVTVKSVDRQKFTGIKAKNRINVLYAQIAQGQRSFRGKVPGNANKLRPPR